MARSIVFSTREEIEAVQESNLREMWDLVAARHPFYRDLVQKLGWPHDHIRSLADLPKLPVTTKSMYMAENSRFLLETAGLPDEMRMIWDTMHTTGSTSGKPTPFVSTTYDFYNILTAQRSMMELRGIRPTDIFANLYPITKFPQGAFHRAIHSAAVMNVPVVTVFPGNPSEYFHHGNSLDEVISIVERTRATVLHGVPSYLRRVFHRAEELSSNLSAVRLLIPTGEPLNEPARAELVASLRRLGAPDPFVSVDYGATELQGALVECHTGSGYHNPAPDQFYLEIVDPETYEPLPDGSEGLLLLTHLKRRGTVLLRYALGDVTVRVRTRCEYCGANTDRLVSVPRRADWLLKIKGMLVNPSLIAQVMDEIASVRDYQIVISKEDAADVLSMDRLTLRICVAGAAENLPREIGERVKRAVGVTPIIEFVEGGVIERPGSWKATRVLDLRSN